jgi:D-alanyl-D-alanine carboxypeptidase
MALFIVITAITAILLASFEAEARPSKRARAAGWQEGFSTIVVDAKTGKVLDSTHPDALRHPASLAKIMTLYLLFEEIERGRLKLASKIKISAEAAAQAPSKLGLKPGETIEVEQAIKAVITRSANDIAFAIAEVISGDEESFAKLMTRRARLIGMKNTLFKNASGLPDPAQVTTARDLALLSLALQDRFPSLYGYFATRTFHWRGVAIGNHNRLLDRVAGVDGIKTGYTHASGYNLVTNVKRDERHIVAVVLGGRTGGARDELMRDLIAANIRHASSGPRTAPRFAEAPARGGRAETTAGIQIPRPAPGSLDPIRPMPVRMVAVGKSGEPLPSGDDKPAASGVLSVSTFSGTSVQQPLQITPFPTVPAAAKAKPVISEPAPMPPAAIPSAPAANAPPAQAMAAVSTPAAASEKAAPTPASRGGWLIQIGAFTKEQEARERLAHAKERAANILSRVSSYTEKTVKGTTEYFRARFAGFDETSAKRACETLKREFACITMKND